MQRNQGGMWLAESQSLRAGTAAKVAYDEGLEVVNVLREEAVGMYQVAVLEAADPKALEAWMTAHQYVYPKGMDGVCAEYIEAKWCFVAVKAGWTRRKRYSSRGRRHANSDLDLDTPMSPSPCRI